MIERKCSDIDPLFSGWAIGSLHDSGGGSCGIIAREPADFVAIRRPEPGDFHLTLRYEEEFLVAAARLEVGAETSLRIEEFYVSKFRSPLLE